MARLRMGVVGVGHLGQAHARVLAGLPGVELVGVADVNPTQAKLVAERHGTTAFQSWQPFLSMVDAATIVVPTCEHFAVAGEFLRRGIPLLVEKPLAATLEQADELVTLAARGGAVLQVGHIERFNPAFEELQRSPIQPKFVEAERHGPFTGRSTDIGVVLDLMIHDLDLLLALVGGPVVGVSAVGAAVFGGHEDMVNARLTFASGCVAHVTVSRIARRPKRRLRIWAPEGYAGLDFVNRRLSLVQPSPQLRQRGLDTSGLSLAERAKLQERIFGHLLQSREIACDPGDQLTRELEHFVQCVRTGSRPRVSGVEGRAAVALAMRVLDSVRSHSWEGRPDGPCGPHQVPRPQGLLFPPYEVPDAAAA